MQSYLFGLGIAMEGERKQVDQVRMGQRSRGHNQLT